MMIISAMLLYALFIYFLAHYLACHRISLRFPCSSHKLIATCVLLFAFLFVPIETLPPMIDTEYGSIILLILVAMAYYIQGSPRRNYLHIVFFAAIFLTFSFFIYLDGIPGHLFCIGTYSSPLIWKALPKVVQATYISIGILFAILLGKQFHLQTAKIKEREFFLLNTLQTLLYIAIFSAIFIPKISFSNQAPYATSYLITFWLGWAKIIIIYYAMHVLHHLMHKIINKPQA